MILTNKFHVEYKMQNIDRDYDVFLVEKKKELYKTNILDLPTEQFQARAVQYSFGNKALVLFSKGSISEQKFKAAIEAEYQDVVIEKLDILNEDVCEKRFYYQNRLLLQLLVNSMRVPKTKDFTYNNLTGKLFYGDTSWEFVDRITKKPYGKYFLEISFDNGVYLNLNVKTFRKKKFHRDGRFYLVDPNNGCFRRKLKTDNAAEDELYVEEGFSDSKNTVPYLKIDSFEEFRKCKLGVMEQFLQDVKKYLGDYVMLTSEQREGDASYQESKKEKENLSNADYSLILKERGVNIVDLCRTPESEIVISHLVGELQEFYNITPSIGGLEKSMYNIRLIHNPEYYEENEYPDPHADDMHGYIVQHMTQEKGLKKLPENPEEKSEKPKKPSAILHKILVELILKDDVHNGKISIYNWDKLRSNKEWTFVRRDRLKPQSEEKCETVENSAEEKTYKHFTYTAVQIDRDGKMEFRTFNDKGLPVDTFEEKVRFAFDDFVEKQKRGKKEVEGLLFSNIDNIHAIIRTCEKTMPNTEAIWKGLKETNVKEPVLTQIVREAIDAYQDFYPEYADYADKIRSQISTLPETVSKGDMKKILNLRAKAGKAFNRFLHEQYEIWISPEMKNTDFSDDFMLENVTGIRYFEDEHTDGQDIYSFNYYAGPRKESLKFAVNNACVVRQVQAQKKVEFKELLPLLAVDFVRIGQFTVLPFPFKYLREYKNMLQ